MDGAMRRNVELVLASVAAGNQMVFIDRKVSNEALAAAVRSEADARRMNVNVHLVEDGVVAELADE